MHLEPNFEENLSDYHKSFNGKG
uniref:Uncharacterized protein n=1 Tax=Rhizophora mucronata TaxID=61149 RepID=A0A2P2Q8Z6_RHIMU